MAIYRRTCTTHAITICSVKHTKFVPVMKPHGRPVPESELHSRTLAMRDIERLHMEMSLQFIGDIRLCANETVDLTDVSTFLEVKSTPSVRPVNSVTKQDFSSYA